LPNPLPNPSTLQFQLNLTTGVVTLVWVAVDNNATSQFGSGHLIGFSPGGASQDPGSINLATALPRTTSPDREALRLSASPEPRSTATTGTTVTYTTENVPEAAPGTGVYVGALILSPAGVPLPGVELGFLGAPGCRAHVLTLASTQALVGGTPTLTTTFVVPAGIAEGFELFAQSCGLVVPFSLPNGQNSFGLVTSNGVLKVLDAEEKTAGGILLPDTAKEKPQRGKVTAVGDGKFGKDGKRLALDVKKGDIVLFGKYAGSDVKVGGEDFKILRESEILAKVEG
jgi:chaperonin GroES